MSDDDRDEKCVFTDWGHVLRGSFQTRFEVANFLDLVIEDVRIGGNRFVYRLKGGGPEYYPYPFPENFTMLIANDDGTHSRMKANDLLDELVSDGSLSLTL